jgi:pimeloyl-ACP methyl ester carboxylesterase
VFAEGYKTVRYDARGYGKTAPVEGKYWPHEDLHGVMKFLGIERAHLLGCSMGGEAIVDFALAHPEKASALIPVCASMSGFNVREGLEEIGKRLNEAYERHDFDACAEIFAQIWVDGPSRAPDAVDRAMRDKIKDMMLVFLNAPDGVGEEQSVDHPAVDRLSEINAPTLVIWGDLDQPGILKVADKLAEGIPGAKKTLIAGTAHVPNMERPEEFNRIVLDFLGGL